MFNHTLAHYGNPEMPFQYEIGADAASTMPSMEVRKSTRRHKKVTDSRFPSSAVDTAWLLTKSLTSAVCPMHFLYSHPLPFCCSINLLHFFEDYIILTSLSQGAGLLLRGTPGTSFARASLALEVESHHWSCGWSLCACRFISCGLHGICSWSLIGRFEFKTKVSVVDCFLDFGEIFIQSAKY